MARIDPEGNEIQALGQLADFSGAAVLEIGAGDGRFTWRYAGDARSVIAIESREADVRSALGAMPRPLRDRVRFHHADATTFRYPRSRFDIAVLSHSL
jgi:ubiquinone/menaquinone biosynthesis C-methylase UbiE